MFERMSPVRRKETRLSSDLVGRIKSSCHMNYLILPSLSPNPVYMYMSRYHSYIQGDATITGECFLELNLRSLAGNDSRALLLLQFFLSLP